MYLNQVLSAGQSYLNNLYLEHKTKFWLYKQTVCKQ